MAYNGFVPSKELQKLKDEYGDDFYIKINMLYIAFEMSELYDENISGSEFDDLCEDILEMSLDDAFENYDIIDITDAVIFIIHDSNYTVDSYEKAYKRNKDRVVEELLAFLEPDSDE